MANRYHNLTSHYNCWFIAKEHLKTVDEALIDGHTNNYNRILTVFPLLDSGVIQSNKQPLSDAIKKASIGITQHPHSNWTDDNFILVGKSRMYQAEFVDAIETFKYVNTKSEDDNTRHAALIYLMRTFIEAGEYGNAASVSDFLKKEDLSRKNLRHLFLTRAHLYQSQDNLDKVVENLVSAVPYMARGNEKARIFFIIGQIYQQLGLDAEAYYHYQQCTRANPEYELFFYARLNMNQVAILDESSDLKRVRKYYNKLLRDDKNIDFRDKIYYEMGRFEQKQGNLDLAIDHYKSSAASSTSNPRQKSYAFWELGKIYFNEIKDYPLAKAYYDSTVQVMPKDEEAFAAIEQRQKVLAEFVEHMTVIAQTDSVLHLANMDSIARVAIFNEIIEAEEKEAAERAKAERRRAATQSQTFAGVDEAGTGSFSGGPQAGGVWYFYNPTAVGSGRTSFVRKWGDRPLENNWRRSNKGLDEGGFGDEEGNLEGSENGQEITASTEGNEAASPEASRAARRKELLATLPLTPEAQQQAYQKLEFAYYRLGNIYRADLEEPVNAIDPFETLLTRFDTSTYVPEVLYQLYLIYQPIDADKSTYYRNQLVNQYPNTLYAKVILNPNYQEESNAATAQAKLLYAQAYSQYQGKAWTEAGTLVDRGLKEYPENDFTDNFELLKILIEAEQAQNIYTYRFALEEFKKSFPESELLPYADRLLSASQSVEERIKKAQAVRYVEYFGQQHLFVLVYDVSQAEADDITQQIVAFNQAQFPDDNLTTANLILNDQYSLVLVNQFATKESATAYYRAFIQDDSTLNGLQRFNFHNFVITKDNFQIFFAAKEPDSYKAFFQKHYLQSE